MVSSSSDFSGDEQKNSGRKSSTRKLPRSQAASKLSAERDQTVNSTRDNESQKSNDSAKNSQMSHQSPTNVTINTATFKNQKNRSELTSPVQTKVHL